MKSAAELRPMMEQPQLRYAEPHKAASFSKLLKQAVKKVVFGDEVLPIRFFIGQPQPQQEVTVLLRGFGPARDVTRCHGPASTIPLTFWITFDGDGVPSETQCARMSLDFRERSGRQRLLGTLGLIRTHAFPAGESTIVVFEARSATGHCHPKLRLLSPALLQRWRQRHSPPKVKLSPFEHKAMSVLFTCPRPISLVSVAEPGRTSVFPLNVMSDVNERYFAFALTASKIPAQFLSSARRFALSAIPFEQAPVAFALAVNHNVPSFDFSDLPFPTTLSRELRLPVPVFAPRVREMEIESVNRVGSHSLFVARVLSDERLAGGDEFSVIHGFYQAWRMRQGLDSASSIERDEKIRTATLASASPVA